MVRQALSWEFTSNHAEAEDLTVFFMELFDLERVLAVLDDIVVAFVPPRNGCKLWARISGKRV